MLRADCLFADFDGFKVAGLRAETGAAVELVRCNFEDNILLPYTTGDPVDDYGHAILKATVNHAYLDTEISITNCTFSGNLPATVELFLADNREASVERTSLGKRSSRATFFRDTFWVDDPSLQVISVCNYEGVTISIPPPACEYSVPLDLEDPYITGSHIERFTNSTSDEWFVAQNLVRTLHNMRALAYHACEVTVLLACIKERASSSSIKRHVL